MLTSIRVQNFRSIRDASVKLGQVNLFIGPNNSGKSNFLKGIKAVAYRISHYPKNQDVSTEWYKENISKGINEDPFSPPAIKISLVEYLSEGRHCDVVYTVKPSGQLFSTEVESTIEADLINDIIKTRDELPLDASKLGLPSPFFSFHIFLQNCAVYKLEPAVFALSAPLSNQPLLEESGINIANFLNTLSQNNDEEFSKLKRDFNSCVRNLTSVSTPPDPNIPGNLKIKFFDNQRNTYWAEDVSEGVMYFLGLLCIIHQPNPPKLLLLEEPEKGIHPRRIREVMNFIFELARQRSIQIIITSHSPYIVDHFADMPEYISIFDRENDETVIHNAADIIAETNAKLEAAGEEPIHYTDALGEYWVSGFLGGVPEILTGI